MNPLSAPHLRVARPSRDLEATLRFYTRALGLELLVSFADHAGIDGVILGHPSWPYHLEFTRRRTDPLVPEPTDEDLLVFYLPEQGDWNAVVQRVRDFGARAVRSANPYWDDRGLTFEDPDGYQVVLRNAAWP
jgi:catechol 2,3-dioxygenase-like lactoylglutathione lyase family enzyme